MMMAPNRTGPGKWLPMNVESPRPVGKPPEAAVRVALEAGQPWTGTCPPLGPRVSDRCGLLTRTIHECRCEAFETEARRGFSLVRTTQAYWQSVEETEREKSRRARGSDDGAGI